MRIVYSSKFKINLRKLTKGKREVGVEVADVVQTIVENPNYPGLRLHKLKNDLREYWSVSVNEDLRIVLYFKSNSIVLVNIGTHKDVYNVN
jgi:addiction module RelE/StbE family toxin